jgi:hypothetical protein
MCHEGLGLMHQNPCVKEIPSDCEKKLLNFQEYAILFRKKQNCVFMHIGNTVEAAMYFDMLGNYIVDAKGAKEVQIRSTSYGKKCVMVML